MPRLDGGLRPGGGGGSDLYKSTATFSQVLQETRAFARSGCDQHQQQQCHYHGHGHRPNSHLRQCHYYLL